MKKLMFFLCVLLGLQSFSQQHYSYKNPYLEITSVSDITTSSARVYYKYSGNGCMVKEVYVEWGDGQVQRYAYPQAVSSPLVETDHFLSNMVESSSCYVYVRITNCFGQASSLVQFSNSAANYPPSVTTVSHSNLGETSVTLNGEVTSEGSSSVTSRGFLYGTSSPPNSSVSSGSGIGTFNYSLSSIPHPLNFIIGRMLQIHTVQVWEK